MNKLILLALLGYTVSSIKLEFIDEIPETVSLNMIVKDAHQEVPVEHHSTGVKTDSDENESIDERIDTDDEISAARMKVERNEVEKAKAAEKAETARLLAEQ